MYDKRLTRRADTITVRDAGEIRAKADALGLTVAELVRRAVAAYDPAWTEGLEARVEQLERGFQRIEDLIERGGR